MQPSLLPIYAIYFNTLEPWPYLRRIPGGLKPLVNTLTMKNFILNHMVTKTKNMTLESVSFLDILEVNILKLEAWYYDITSMGPAL